MELFLQFLLLAPLYFLFDSFGSQIAYRLLFIVDLQRGLTHDLCSLLHLIFVCALVKRIDLVGVLNRMNEILHHSVLAIGVAVLLKIKSTRLLLLFRWLRNAGLRLFLNRFAFLLPRTQRIVRVREHELALLFYLVRKLLQTLGLVLAARLHHLGQSDVVLLSFGFDAVEHRLQIRILQLLLRD